jgi:uridine phosphorylase
MIKKNMPKQAKQNDVQYHTGLSKNMIKNAEYALLPGDPQRVESIAKIFDPQAVFLADSREHKSFLANFHGQHILVCSTGVGAPNVSITLEELAVIGLKYYLRIGTCGSIQPRVELGDVVISKASVRLDGASKDYAPVEYPAVASFEFTNDIIEGAKKAQAPFHVGITASTDTFWQGQERHDSYTGYLIRSKRDSMAEWQALNVLNFEMESSALFVMSSVMGLKAACLSSVIAKRVESEKISLNAKTGAAKTNWEKVAYEGIYFSMKRRGLVT